MRRMIKRERRMKSNGRRINQPKRELTKRSENLSLTLNIFASLFPTNLLTIDASR
jgi:hypothetical protein